MCHSLNEKMIMFVAGICYPCLCINGFVIRQVQILKLHPGNLLKQYQISLLVDELKKEGLI